MKMHTLNAKWLLSAVLITWLTCPVLHAQESDPTLAPIPVTGIQTETRALIIRYRYDPETPAEYVGAFLSNTLSRQTASAAPQIAVISEDVFGEVMDVFNADYNHWVHGWDDAGNESKLEQYGEVGRIIMPFESFLERVTLHDRAQNTDVLVIEISEILADICVNGSLNDPSLCNIEVSDIILSSGFEAGEEAP